MTSTVLATYDNVEDARNAITDLKNAGINSNDIGLAVQNSEDVDAAEGASFGATTGSIIGLVVGLGAIVIPGVGPVIVAGPLAAAFGAITGAGIGAAAGAATGGIIASLVNLGVPEEEAHYYAESLRRGAALVSITRVGNADVDRVKYILRNYDPIDMDEQITEWRSAGWTGFDPAVEPYSGSPALAGYGDLLDEDITRTHEDTRI